MLRPHTDPSAARDDAAGDLENADEAELAERAKTSPPAFGLLYERYYRKILGYVYRRTLDAAVAEELTSNTFFNALCALPAYEHRGHFAAWLYRIATNEIRFDGETRRSGSRALADGSTSLAACTSPPTDSMERRTQKRRCGPLPNSMKPSAVCPTNIRW